MADNIENSLSQISIFKKIGISCDKQTSNKIEIIEKLLQVAKKQVKENKINIFQSNNIYQSIFQQLNNLMRVSYFQFRLQKTDFQALICLQKYIQQGISKLKYPKMSDQIIINSNHISIDIEIQSFTLRALCQKSAHMIYSLPYVRSSQYQIDILNNFVKNICKNYNIVPYHNFTHAFGVFLFLYECFLKIDIKDWANDFELFFALIACLCHDLQHNAKNTLFQSKIKSNLAITYSNQSVLQKMHLSKTIAFLQKDQNWNPYKILGKDQKVRARRIISKCIMATDMFKHYDYVRDINSKKLDKSIPNDRQFVLEVFTHACDIGNPCMNFNNYMYWANLICMQFNNQTRLQQAMSVQVTEYMKFNSLAYFYKNQLTFASNVVVPLWQGLSNKFSSLQHCIQRIKSNNLKVNEKFRRNSQPSLSLFQDYLQKKI